MVRQLFSYSVRRQEISNGPVQEMPLDQCETSHESEDSDARSDRARQDIWLGMGVE